MFSEPTNSGGLPENLQWRTMRQSVKERFTNDRVYDSSDRIPVDRLTPEGQAIILRTILKEVLVRSKDKSFKDKATQRNKQEAQRGTAELRVGDLLQHEQKLYICLQF